MAQGKIICSIGPWTPHTANKSQLPFHIERGRKVLRSPERKQGLADVTRETGRIKEFRLNDALLYSYMYDLRFVLLTCLVIGFSIWWMAVPEPLLESPKALCSPLPSFPGNRVHHMLLSINSGPPGMELQMERSGDTRDSCLREHAFISMEREREREKGMHGRERERNRLSRFLQSAVNESKPPLGPGPAPIRRNNDWNRWLSGLAGLRKE